MQTNLLKPKAIHVEPLALNRAKVTDELLGVAVNTMTGQTNTINVPRTVHRGVEFAANGQFGGDEGIPVAGGQGHQHRVLRSCLPLKYSHKPVRISYRV